MVDKGLRMNNELIYGKNPTERIVAIEPGDATATLFIENEAGQVETKVVANSHYILFSKQHSDKFKRLAGDQHYKYMVEYDSRAKWREVLKASSAKRYDTHVVRNQAEALMIKDGFTLFKGMKVEDVSVLSIDIETNTGLQHTKDSKVLLISMAYRSKGQINRYILAYDEFSSQAVMLKAFTDLVQLLNPSVIVGHNLFGYDFPFMQHCAKLNDVTLDLGRDHSPIQFDNYTSHFRKDGSQTIDYTGASIYGRQIVDTFFLSIKYDIGRNYPSYKLKDIIAYEGLERKNRQHYDASQISKNYTNPEEWAKIKEYAKDDADDALALFNLMVPSFFYYTQNVPRTLQQIINTATGSQVNSVMVRAYLQQGHSIPQASEASDYEGAISLSNPGIYKNVYKVDVASLYPSIIRQFKIYDKDKDPEALFLKMVEYFTLQRLENKRLGKETGDRHYKDLEQSQKIMINSAYGFLGTPGLAYNSPLNAALVTRKGREFLQDGLMWACGSIAVQVPKLKKSGKPDGDKKEWKLGPVIQNDNKKFKIVNADTDSFSYTLGKKLTDAEFKDHVTELNSLFPEMIRWENDGYYKKVIVVRTKNYVLQDEKNKVKIKGSGLKGSMKEKALQNFMKETIDLLLKNKADRIFYLYLKYANEAANLEEMSRWCSKKTVTKALLNPERTNEQRPADALVGSEFSEGDKVFMFYKTPEKLCLLQNFDGIYDKSILLSKLYKTMSVFDTVLDISLIPNLSNKCNADLI
jgi:DNA polymerase I